ncbi:MAG: hypothetical protein ACE5IP_05165 [Terriglobia bacterium]
MFDSQRAVLSAAGLGYLLSGFLVALAGGSAYFVFLRDPHRLVRQWDQWLAQRAQLPGVGVLGGLLLFLVALAGLIFFLAVAARAARLHPTSALLGGLLLTAGLLAVGALAVWRGMVAPYAALQYQWTREPAARAALLVEARMGEHFFQLGLWCFLGFAAPGLYFLGRAVRGERGWLPDVLKLAAALILLHLPVTLYVARESLLHQRYLRWLAVLDQLWLWSGLALAVFFCARWLRTIGRALPR